MGLTIYEDPSANIGDRYLFTYSDDRPCPDCVEGQANLREARALAEKAEATADGESVEAVAAARRVEAEAEQAVLGCDCTGVGMEPVFVWVRDMDPATESRIDREVLDAAAKENDGKRPSTIPKEYEALRLTKILDWSATRSKNLRLNVPPFDGEGGDEGRTAQALSKATGTTIEPGTEILVDPFFSVVRPMLLASSREFVDFVNQKRTARRVDIYNRRRLEQLNLIKRSSSKSSTGAKPIPGSDASTVN